MIPKNGDYNRPKNGELNREKKQRETIRGEIQGGDAVVNVQMEHLFQLYYDRNGENVNCINVQFWGQNMQFFLHAQSESLRKMKKMRTLKGESLRKMTGNEITEKKITEEDERE